MSVKKRWWAKLSCTKDAAGVDRVKAGARGTLERGGELVGIHNQVIDPEKCIIFHFIHTHGKKELKSISSRLF